MYWAAAVGFAASVAFFALRPVLLQSYLLSEQLGPGWVAVEHGNAGCMPLKAGRFWQEVEISESGYACTSSPIVMGWVYERYFRVDGRGGRERLEVGKDILARATVSVDTNDCRFTADTFWYGQLEERRGARTDLLRRQHPECRGLP